ncbi:MAG: PEP-CTERM sorting domain-containing protein [Bryobacteraceae bacterium]
MRPRKNFHPIKSLLAVIGLIGTGSHSLQAAVVIDSFADFQMATLGAGKSNPKTIYNTGLSNAPGSIGGQREFSIRRTSGIGGIDVNVNSFVPNAFYFATVANAKGSALITYDGPNAAKSTYPSGVPNTFGLAGLGTTGGVDLTEDGANALLQFSAYATGSGLPVTFTFYNSKDNWASTTLELEGSPDLSWSVYNLKFCSFNTVGTLNALDIFRDTKAITVQLNGSNGSDAALGAVLATPTPEPTTTGIMALGLVGLAALARRRAR